MAQEPSVAVVILNWNGKHHLEKYLPALLRTNYGNMRVVVADNASGDDSLLFLETNYPDIRIIRLAENYGFAKGYNEALRQVESDYYVLLNSDVEVSPEWLRPMVDLLEKKEDVAACQPVIKMEAVRTRFEYAGAAGGWLDSLGYPFARGRIFDFCETDEGQYPDDRPVAWASGAALLIRSSLYHASGGLDPIFFAHQEEIDLCWRIQLMGYRIFVCSRSEVFHVGGGTLPKGNERKVYLNFRNNLIMLCKNLPYVDLTWKLPLRFLLDAVSAWKSLLAGEKAYFIAILHAHGYVIRWMLGSKKGNLFPVKRGNPKEGWYKGSIVYQHFVRGKKKFSEIISGH